MVVIVMKEKLSLKDNIDNIIGETLANLRKDLGLTQAEFANIFNLSGSAVAHYEQGITIPNSEMLCKFADYFNVTVDYLLGRCSCKVEYQKLNDRLYRNMSLGDMVNIVSELPKEKQQYLYQTIVMLQKP